ncbi:acetyl-CoA acetyltransferase [Rhodoligotrophos ferricapiens]|uniref:acetyl-CoA acetyltransferase n=1 Tax=Rhodoligotrophos ferricapiens TaxID=3069264 RepID=UPI00315DA435
MGCIVGWAHSQFGKLEGQALEDMIARVAHDAVKDAGIEFSDIDAIYVGNFGGFEKQSFPAAFALDADPALRFKPATRVENACATGSAAVQMGLNEIYAKKSRFVLVVGAEKMTAASGAEIGDALLNASYRKTEADTPGGFAGVFARIQDLYQQRYGDQSEATARIAAKNHKNGVENPYAQMRKDFGFEFCNSVSDKNPIVVGQIRRTDCSLVSDGAAAIVLTDVETAMRMPKAVHFRGIGHAQDYLPMAKRDIVAFEGCEAAWKKAHEQAGTSLDDLSFVETHDCFTIAELIEYEAMGLTPRGQGARAINEGWTEKDGKLPVNPSGGLKSKGHPIGATGVSMHIMASMQLLGQAGGMQVKDPKLAGIFNMGGAAVANYVSILERLR